ncbi:MAG: PTS sugar transporter subunit IIC [bacterium]
MLFLKIFQIALVAGLIGLDRLAFGQFMVSQPIVAAPLIGWMMGDFHTGLLIGVVLELFWLRGLPIGGHIPRDATLSAILTAGLCLSRPGSIQGLDTAWMAWVFLWVGILLLPAGFLDQWIRRKNALLIRMALSSESPEHGVTRAVWMGILIFFLYYFGVTFMVVGFTGGLLGRGYALLPGDALQGLRLFLFLLPALGLASLLARKDIMQGRIHLAAGTVASFLIFIGLKQQSMPVLVSLFLLSFIMVYVQERRVSVS